MSNEAANAFLDDAASRGGRSLDTAAGTSPGNSTVKCRVVGIATGLGGQTYDQASFFSQIGDVVIAGETYILATVTPAQSRYTSAKLTDYITFNPLPLRNINVTGANSADAVSSISVIPNRITPQGQSAFDTINASDYQTAQDFQDTRVQIPMALVIDGYTYLQIVNDAQATAVQYSIAFLFGPRMDRRLDVPDAGPVQIRSPGR
jgi:hypothetical protein